MGRLSSFAAKAARKVAKEAEERAVATAEKDTEKAAVRAAKSFSVKPKVKALPAPAKPLALPKPGPGLPDFAAKPRGGQWWADKSPYGLLNPAVSSKENIYLGARFSSDPTDKALADWWDKALPRYIQNDFATPDDPFRALADQGYLQGVENAAQWSNRVKRDIVPMPLQKLLFDPKTAEIGVRDEALAAMPWINKMPATENIYGFWPREETIGALSHIRDEMVNALKPDASGIPADLAVRPESLGRMSFAQAAERVGLINQWRAKQAEQAQLSALNNPAIHTFKEYAENNPMGLRWVELKAPDPAERFKLTAVEENGKPFWQATDPDTGEVFPLGGTREQAIESLRYQNRDPLQQALKYEGDTMGHCVGGYCDDVLSGRSRIFSLRDAKGEPHVTIETGKGYIDQPHRLVPEEVQQQIDAELMARGTLNYGREFERELRNWVAQNVELPENIIQIKGKQNRAPKDDYLPFVQDFVKSGKWGNIGDLENTGLVKLPDGRYITPSQVDEALGAANLNDATRQHLRSRIVDQELSYNPELWGDIAPHFEGYAIGGRVAADRCFCKHPMSVKRAA